MAGDSNEVGMTRPFVCALGFRNMMLPYQKQVFHIQLYLLENPEACLDGGGGDISGICVCTCLHV